MSDKKRYRITGTADNTGTTHMHLDDAELDIVCKVLRGISRGGDGPYTPTFTVNELGADGKSVRVVMGY